jgi:hypothetical protein
MTGACMGGWCAHRVACARYHAANTWKPAERLCAPGRSNAFVPRTVVEDPAIERGRQLGIRLRAIFDARTQRVLEAAHG